MTTTNKSSARRVSDIFKSVLDPAYCCESGTFRNNSGSTITVAELAGTPVKKSGGKWVPILTTDEGNCGGVIISKHTVTSLANNTDFDEKVAVLVRGPAILNQDALPTKDVEDATLVPATLATRLLTLGIVCQRDTGASELNTWFGNTN